MKGIDITVSIACLGLALASPLERRYAVKEIHTVPSTFSRESAANGDQVLRMQIGLTQSRFQDLERHIYESQLPVLLRLRQDTEP